MKKEEKRVLISTVYSGKAVKVAINKLSIDKIILIVDEPIDNTKKKTIDKLKEFYKNLLEIKTLKAPLYDIQKIVKIISGEIDEEYQKGNEILLHITEGRKITSLALLFSGYFRKEKIQGAYYVIEEDNHVLPLPLININLGESKKKILAEIINGNGVVHSLEKRLKLKPSAIYQHIQELKQEGYIEDNKELRLTDLGRMMIL